jgi:predicted nucleotidyltransferase
MRLTAEQVDIIRQTAHQRFGDGTRVWLFGSRVDDSARGGDIDLLVEITAQPDNAFRESIALETDLQLALGDQKIDILLHHPGNSETPIHRIARNSGVEL